MKSERGSFRIQKMTVPSNEWIWSFWNESDSPAGLSKSGYKTAEDAARYICQFLKSVGANTEEVDIWIERTQRSRWQCDAQQSDSTSKD